MTTKQHCADALQWAETILDECRRELNNGWYYSIRAGGGKRAQLSKLHAKRATKILEMAQNLRATILDPLV